MTGAQSFRYYIFYKEVPLPFYLCKSLPWKAVVHVIMTQQLFFFCFFLVLFSWDKFKELGYGRKYYGEFRLKISMFHNIMLLDVKNRVPVHDEKNVHIKESFWCLFSFIDQIMTIWQIREAIYCLLYLDNLFDGTGIVRYT